jgi:hypothetical protein
VDDRLGFLEFGDSEGAAQAADAALLVAAFGEAVVDRLRGSGETSAMICATRLATSAVCPGILTATVFPADRAGASDRMSRATGEFQGTIMPTTPAGSA